LGKVTIGTIITQGKFIFAYCNAITFRVIKYINLLATTELKAKRYVAQLRNSTKNVRVLSMKRTSK